MVPPAPAPARAQVADIFQLDTSTVLLEDFKGALGEKLNGCQAKVERVAFVSPQARSHLCCRQGAVVALVFAPASQPTMPCRRSRSRSQQRG